MDTINTISDLCEYFNASGPDELNRRMYRDHEARISIVVGEAKPILHTYTIAFSMGEHHPIVDSTRKNGEFCRFSSLHVDVKHLFHLRLAGDIVESDVFKNVEDFLSGCKDFMQRQNESDLGTDFVKIKQIDENTVTVVHSHLHDDSRWMESGERWKVSKKTKLQSFVIHSTVEGSEVTVQSEPFVIPVETKAVDEWLTEMKKQVDFYWKRENYSHWFLTSPEGNEFYFDTGWSEIVWHDENKVPDSVKKLAENWAEQQSKNTIGVSHKFGVKGWTIEEYQDDATYEG